MRLHPVFHTFKQNYGHIRFHKTVFCELFNPHMGELGKGILEFYRNPEFI